jgi:hypothetical protein
VIDESGQQCTAKKPLLVFAMLLRATVAALQLVSLQARTEQHRATLLQTACKLSIIKVASQRLTCAPPSGSVTPRC